MDIEPRNYITENIFLLYTQLYYEKNEKIQPIKNHNWHHLLSEYGWEKLPKQWIRKLNSFLDNPKNNSPFGSLDCGGEGDCLFHSISYALVDYDSEKLRKEISENISEERYIELIELYKIINQADDFDEMWNPEEMTYENFKRNLNEGGEKYWGDFLTVCLIKEYLDINIIILNSNEITNEYYYYSLFYEYNEKTNTIILLYENEIHFKLVGYFQNGNMNYYFNHQSIPYEILKLIKYLR
jgi:hypothetical protein